MWEYGVYLRKRVPVTSQNLPKKFMPFMPQNVKGLSQSIAAASSGEK